MSPEHSRLLITLVLWSGPALFLLLLLLVYLRYRIDSREMRDAARHALVGHRPCDECDGAARAAAHSDSA